MICINFGAQLLKRKKYQWGSSSSRSDVLHGSAGNIIEGRDIFKNKCPPAKNILIKQHLLRHDYPFARPPFCSNNTETRQATSETNPTRWRAKHSTRDVRLVFGRVNKALTASAEPTKSS